jgi:hypothetical protein
LLGWMFVVLCLLAYHCTALQWHLGDVQLLLLLLLLGYCCNSDILELVLASLGLCAKLST